MKTPRPPALKVLSREEFLEHYRRPRNFKLVFTNGCFDILHRGHVEYLHQAAALGDTLVIGVNTDASVERLKGPGRPVVPQEDRALVLAALESVEAVTLFHEDTPQELLVELLPDVLVKGGDYSPDEVVGRKEVQEAGGRVEIIPFIRGRSTTKLINQIQDVE